MAVNKWAEADRIANELNRVLAHEFLICNNPTQLYIAVLMAFSELELLIAPPVIFEDVGEAVKQCLGEILR